LNTSANANYANTVIAVFLKPVYNFDIDTGHAKIYTGDEENKQQKDSHSITASASGTFGRGALLIYRNNQPSANDATDKPAESGINYGPPTENRASRSRSEKERDSGEPE
jgi:hypothetical protein